MSELNDCSCYLNGINHEICSNCLKSPKCQVESCINNSLLFVAYFPELFCDRVMSYGTGHICKCKGRKTHYDTFQK